MDRSTSEVDGAIVCVSFANTAHDFNGADIGDDIATYADLLEWARCAGVISRERKWELGARAKRSPREAEAALASARAMRASIYRILGARSRDVKARIADLLRLNVDLAAAMAGAALDASGKRYAWRLAEGKGLAEPILWPVARSAAKVLTSENAPRIVECGGRTCTWLVVDTTKNRSRKYCSSQGCGNRARVRRFYERQRSRGVSDRTGR